MNDFIRAIYQDSECEAVEVEGEKIIICIRENLVEIPKDKVRRLNELVERLLPEFLLEDITPYVALESSELRATFRYENHAVELKSLVSEDTIEINYFKLLKIFYRYLHK